jgi:hypothetical protein
MFKYNYILYFSEKDYYKIIYSDFYSMKGVEIHHSFRPQNKFLSYLHKLHNSNIINNCINLPLKSLWYSCYLKNDIKSYENEKICFIFMFTWIELIYIKEYIKFLHNKFPKAKFVCYFTDLVSTLDYEPQSISSLFDLLVSYDRNDAAVHGMKCFPTSFSNYKVRLSDKIESCDVLFLGKSKGRLKKILSVYRQLQDANIKCLFYIIDSNIEERIDAENIHYLDNPMGYDIYLQHVQKCKCILEIVQDGSIGETLRTWEAINYDKLLLTDNFAILDSKFYSNDYVSVIKDGRIDIDNVKNYRPIRNMLKESIRPINLLKYIESNLLRYE